MFSVKVNHSNPNWQKQYKKRLLESKKQEIAVGYPRGAEGVAAPHYPNGESILAVAFRNNYGDEGVPARPFIPDSEKPLDENYKAMLKKAIPQINAGKLTYTAIYKAIAIESESIIRNQITNGDYVPNSPYTAARKGSSKPLIDSGDMRKYVTSVIRNK